MPEKDNNVEDVLTSFARSFGIKDSDPKVEWGGSAPTDAQAADLGDSGPMGESDSMGVGDEDSAQSFYEFEADADSDSGAETEPSDEGKREAKDFESEDEPDDEDSDDVPADEPPPPAPKDNKTENDKPKGEKGEDPEPPQEPECPNCKIKDEKIRELGARLNASKMANSVSTMTIDALETTLSEKDGEIERLKAQLAERDERLGRLESELGSREFDEAACVPDGFTWTTYLESLEGKIRVFKDLVKINKRVVYTFHNGIESECRLCKAVVNNKKLERKLDDPTLHKPSCPLYKALGD